MISRKKILSRSQSEIDYENNYNPYECEDEIWFTKEKLYADHIEEILKKWENIDDEIWGKIIYMERNRRIAKAYARAPVLCINGSKDGFDGYKIGLNGFDNVVNDPIVKRVKRHIGQGVRVKIEETGNIIVKRLSNCDVFIRGWNRDANSISKEIIDLSGELEYEKSVKLFDMKKFQSGVNKELRSAYPDRRKLEAQCVCAIAFVKDAENILELPVWCLIVNIVALDMLKSKLPPIAYKGEISVPKFLTVFEKNEVAQEEDPYSVPLPINNHNNNNYNNNNNNNYKSHNEIMKSTRKTLPMINNESKPPELPPRDLSRIKKTKTRNFPKMFRFMRLSSSKENMKTQQHQQQQQQQQQRTTNKHQLKDDKDYEDPYYCGMRARLCNNSNNNNNNNNNQREQQKIYASMPYAEMRKTQSNGYLNSLFHSQPRSSSYYSHYDSSFDSDPYAISSTDYDIYGPVYGRIRNNNNNNNSIRNHYIDDRIKYASQWN